MIMSQQPFYKSNKMTAPLEHYIQRFDSLEEFEKNFPQEFLDDDDQIGNYLQELLIKYDMDHATVSRLAGLHRSYVGNIVRKKKNNPGRDALIAICLVMRTTVDEVQYLLKYAGHVPLYVRRKRDVVIWYGFMKHAGIVAVNADLSERGYKTFPCEKEE